VVNPARAAIYPRLLPPELLPAANALSVVAMNLTMLVGPLLAGVLVDVGGFTTAYTVDAVLFTTALWGLWRLPPQPPEGGKPARRAGLRSVWDGLAFLGTRPNVRMTFLADLVAMILAQPRALLPAIAALALGGGARTVGVLTAAIAAGGLVAMVLSGPLGRIRRQGLAVVVSVVGWGASFAGFGAVVLAAGHQLPQDVALQAAVVAMACAGAADAVSAVFRTTILQSATPDHLRGRLQGVFVVVVAGGPRLGELVSGVVASWIGEGRTALLGGIACVVGVLALAAWQRGFLRYDARHPTP
jgi:MFS family permease